MAPLLWRTFYYVVLTSLMLTFYQERKFTKLVKTILARQTFSVYHIIP